MTALGFGAMRPAKMRPPARVHISFFASDTARHWRTISSGAQSAGPKSCRTVSALQSNVMFCCAVPRAVCKITDICAACPSARIVMGQAAAILSAGSNSSRYRIRGASPVQGCTARCRRGVSPSAKQSSRTPHPRQGSAVAQQRGRPGDIADAQTAKATTDTRACARHAISIAHFERPYSWTGSIGSSSPHEASPLVPYCAAAGTQAADGFVQAKIGIRSWHDTR